jgi:hypothetical protein
MNQRVTYTVFLDFKLSLCSVLTVFTHFKPLKMDPTEGSETSANINQTLGIHPKVETVNIQYLFSPLSMQCNLIHRDLSVETYVKKLYFGPCIFFRWIKKPTNAVILQRIDNRDSPICFGTLKCHHQGVNRGPAEIGAQCCGNLKGGSKYITENHKMYINVTKGGHCIPDYGILKYRNM